MPPGRGHNGDPVMHPSGARSISGEPPRNRQSRAKKPRHRGPMPGFPSRGEQRKEPNSILIRGLSASPVFSLRTFSTFSTFSTESPEAQCPWNGHCLRQLGAFPAPGSSPCLEQWHYSRTTIASRGHGACELWPAMTHKRLLVALSLPAAPHSHKPLYGGFSESMAKCCRSDGEGSAHRALSK